MRLIRSLLSWCLALFLIAVLLHWTLQPFQVPVEGEVLLYDLPGENRMFSRLAAATDLSALEPTGRLSFGVFLLILSFGLLIPPLRKGAAWGALLATGLVAIVHLTGRDLQEASAASDSMLYLSLASWMASVLLIVTHPKKIGRSA